MKLGLVGITFLLVNIIDQSQAQVSAALDPACFACRCPRNLDFECGSDGRTYQNDCLYQCALEKCPEMTKDVIITRKGKCEERDMKIGMESMELEFTDD